MQNVGATRVLAALYVRAEWTGEHSIEQMVALCGACGGLFTMLACSLGYYKSPISCPRARNDLPSLLSRST